MLVVIVGVDAGCCWVLGVVFKDSSIRVGVDVNKGAISILLAGSSSIVPRATYVCVCVCVYICVCVYKERERESVCVCVCTRVCIQTETDRDRQIDSGSHSLCTS